MSANQQLANRLALAAADCLDAKRYLEIVLERKARKVKDHGRRHFDYLDTLVLSAVVVYARSFKKSKSAGRAISFLRPSEHGLFATRPELEAFHNAVVSERDQSVAHSDWVVHQTELYQTSLDSYSVMRRMPRQRPHVTLDILQFLELVTYMYDTCATRHFYLDKFSMETESESLLPMAPALKSNVCNRD